MTQRDGKNTQGYFMYEAITNTIMLIWCVQISGISVPTGVWNLRSFLILVSHQRSFRSSLKWSKFHSRNITKKVHRVAFQLQVNMPSKKSYPITYLSCYTQGLSPNWQSGNQYYCEVAQRGGTQELRYDLKAAYEREWLRKTLRPARKQVMYS